jgi:hypothetical protein
MGTRRVQPSQPETDEQFEDPKATKRAARKAAAPKAAKAPKPEPEVDADGNPVRKTRTVRGDRNHLARSIDSVLRAADGPVSVKDIAAGVTYEDGSHPSSGAVAAALIRWADAGYITVSQKPLSFKAFPAKSKGSTLDAFLEKQRETRLKDRRAARAAASA